MSIAAGITAIEMLFKAIDRIWTAKGQIENSSREERNRIADFCTSIAERLEHKRNGFYSGRGFRSISVPHEMRSYAQKLQQTAPDIFESEHASILVDAANAIDVLEDMTPAQFSELEREAQSQHMKPINEAIGQFQALSNLLRI